MLLKLKTNVSVLHIGGGRFYYAGQTYNDSDVPLEFQEKYFDGTEDESPDNEPEPHTATSIKKLNADAQKELIVELGGDPETTKNEEERISLILDLQEQGE